MKVGFWNVERAGNLEGTMVASLRAGLMLAYVEAWLKGTNLNAPDVLILCEVTLNGATHIISSANTLGYRAEFVQVADKNGNLSPCSFAAIAKHGYWKSVAPVGSSTKRPYIKLDTGDFIVAGCHILATRGEKSASEIFAMVTDLDGEKKPCVLIGDMNYSFADDPDVGAGWTKVAPGIPATHKSDSAKPGSVIDYLWHDDLIKNCQAIPVGNGNYTDWDTLDHAPISYEFTK